MKREEITFIDGAEYILSFCHLEQYTDFFLSSADGMAILAHLCNALAKQYEEESDDLYEWKPVCIEAAILAYRGEERYDAYWAENGIIYLETAYGQVSFHDFGSLWRALPDANGRTWDRRQTQKYALEFALAFLLGWTYEEHQNALLLLAQKVRQEEESVIWLYPGMFVSIVVESETDAIRLIWRK